MTTLVLGVLALTLAGPVPWLLLQVPRLCTVPRAAMVLWQSLALASVLAALGAGLALFTDSAFRAHPSSAQWAIAAFALTVTLTVLARLLLTGHQVGTRLRHLRRRHRDLVDVLSADNAGIRVLDLDAPMAYCLPGFRSRVVVSKGAIATLEPAQLTAVLAHERAHLRARHDLVLEAFAVLHKAFPRFVSRNAVVNEVRLLVEVLADRAAVRRSGAQPVATALVTLAAAVVPEAALGAGGPNLVRRVELMGDTSPHRGLATAVYLSASLVLALPTIFVALPWLQSL